MEAVGVANQGILVFTLMFVRPFLGCFEGIIGTSFLLVGFAFACGLLWLVAKVVSVVHMLWGWPQRARHL